MQAGRQEQEAHHNNRIAPTVAVTLISVCMCDQVSCVLKKKLKDKIK